MNPRRLTEAGAVELALCVAQYFYYTRDTPIMTDADYDQLEQHYKSFKTHGVIKDLLKGVGCGDNLDKWLTAWREYP